MQTQITVTISAPQIAKDGKSVSQEVALGCGEKVRKFVYGAYINPFDDVDSRCRSIVSMSSRCAERMRVQIAAARFKPGALSRESWEEWRKDLGLC